jgi:2-polyprenyl-3-methyl-5-hydroxy-6-metoxy-1,4-benzoquinol methylase
MNSEAKLSTYYSDPRTEIAALIPRPQSRVLDVGCADGSAGKHMLDTHRAAWVTGIESNSTQADIARRKLNEVITADVSSAVLTLPAASFDCITCGDVLEHLQEPWATLRSLKSLLNADGVIIASIPNVRFLPVVYDLVMRGQWTYKESGVLDITHLRFFTKATAVEMFIESGFTLEMIAPYFSGRRYSLLSRLSFGLLDGFLAERWLMRFHQ